jgi:tRNA (mo5U34)-methyltransferase
MLTKSLRSAIRLLRPVRPANVEKPAGTAGLARVVPAAPAPAPCPKERARLQALVDSCHCWWHSIDLGHGVVTPGHKGRPVVLAEWAAFRLPDLRGKSVLDIGAWDGVYSFEAERHGAARVVALDHYVWSLDLEKTSSYWKQYTEAGRQLPEWQTMADVWFPQTLPGKRGFDTAHAALNSKVEAVVADFMTVDLDVLGAFDVVLYLGVLYHMRNPLGALERLARVTRDLAVIETAGIIVPGREQHALCEFYPGAELGNDPTNWWAPNPTALQALCLAAGFRKAEVIARPPEAAGDIQRCRLIAQAWK